MQRFLFAFLVLVAGIGMPSLAAAQKTLLNASYSATREFYADVDKAFAAQWKRDTGESLSIETSNGGSGAQARAVIGGLPADVVTLALGYDIDAIADKAKLLPEDWQKRLPDNSTPYTSTIVFLVRKGNPKHIHDWPDLLRPDVKVITPNPKTSGGARWNFLAAWGYALKANGGDEAKARDFVKRLYKNVLVMDTGARGSTITFTQRHQGDVLIAWESEALLAENKFGKNQFDIVTPSISILAEPSVALVAVNARQHGTVKEAEAYLHFLYTPEGQELAAEHYFRPRSATILARYAKQFPKVTLFTLHDMFGNWRHVQAKYFADGGVFDQIYRPGG